MKAFEKWWEKNMPDDMRYESAYHRTLLHDGWRAALEWVLSQDTSFCQCGCIEHFIEEELND